MFWTLLLATWGWLNAIFLDGDLCNLYVALELLTFVAVPLVSLDGPAETLAAALRYVLFALLGLILYLLALLWRWRDRLPRVPESDIVVVGEMAVRASAVWGEAIERADGYLRRWPVVSLSLLMLVIILGAAMLAWG